MHFKIVNMMLFAHVFNFFQKRFSMAMKFIPRIYYNVLKDFLTIRCLESFYTFVTLT